MRLMAAGFVLITFTVIGAALQDSLGTFDSVAIILIGAIFAYFITIDE